MGFFRVRRRIKILPGVHLNLGKTGVTTSIGGKGLTVNLGKRKTTTTVGIPGTGMSYTESSPADQSSGAATLLLILGTLLFAVWLFS